MDLIDLLLNRKPEPEFNRLLHHCPNCGSERAALAPDWTYCDEDATANPDGNYAELHIMCGECQMWRYVIASDADGQRWELEVLDPGERAIHRLAETLDRVRFKDYCATFIGSLRHDVLLPEDF